MNGTRYLLDTNAVIAIVNGNQEVVSRLNSASFVAFSIVSVIEFLAFRGLSENDKLVFEEIVSEGSVVNLDYADKILVGNIVTIRKNFKLKLPDAIIAATAMIHNCQIISNDKELLKVPGLATVNFSL